MPVIEEAKNLQKGEFIKLSVKDTSFLIAALNRSPLNGAEVKQAYNTMHKLESLHEYLLNREQLVKGV